MMENLRCRVPSVETELNEPESSSGKGKIMRVWRVKSASKGFSGRFVVFLPVNLRGLKKVFLIHFIDHRIGPGEMGVMHVFTKQCEKCNSRKIWENVMRDQTTMRMMFDGKSRP